MASPLTTQHTHAEIGAERDWEPVDRGRPDDFTEFLGEKGVARAWWENDETTVVVLDRNGVIEWKVYVSDGVPVAILAVAMVEAEKSVR